MTILSSRGYYTKWGTWLGGCLHIGTQSIKAIGNFRLEVRKIHWKPVTQSQVSEQGGRCGLSVSVCWRTMVRGSDPRSTSHVVGARVWAVAASVTHGSSRPALAQVDSEATGWNATPSRSPESETPRGRNSGETNS